jgi:hypothetical protein
MPAELSTNSVLKVVIPGKGYQTELLADLRKRAVVTQSCMHVYLHDHSR